MPARRLALNTQLLIDAIVHQTTVLIAQLSTAAGIRAPLAHVADQVFLELSREIEAQGVSRKVAADMFGLAIRTYQKKVQRLSESVTDKGDTLWETALTYLQTHGSAPRRVLLEHLSRQDPAVVGSVLNDLVSSGLVYKTGAGDTTIFGLTKARDLSQTLSEQRRESLAPVVWLLVYRSGGIGFDDLLEQLPVEQAAVRAALDTLLAENRVQRSGDEASPTYRATTFLVPVDSEHGWEAAVFDHFQAMVQAIGTKLRRGRTRSVSDDVLGGATISFDISAEHPHRERVLGLLKRVRSDVNELWGEVQSYNQENPIPEESRTEVSFYFGQCVTPPDEEG
jgi:hypothetical protein